MLPTTKRAIQDVDNRTDARLRDLEFRVKSLEGEMVRSRIDRFKDRLAAAAERGALKPGTAVLHLLRHAPAIVIPRPHNAKELSTRGDTLVYVMWQDGSVRGCWPENLVRL